jgi:hypothetical protein
MAKEADPKHVFTFPLRIPQLTNAIPSVHIRFRWEWLVVVIGHATLVGFGLDPRLDVDGVM